MARLKNHRHEAFARNYVIRGYNATAAARAARVGEDRAGEVGRKWLDRPDIVLRIQEIMDEEYEEIKHTKQDILNECAKQAMFDMADLYDENGQFIPLHEQDRDISINVSKVKMDAMTRRIIEVQAGKDKSKSIDMMMKYHNSYEDHQKAANSEIKVYLSEKDLQA